MHASLRMEPSNNDEEISATSTALGCPSDSVSWCTTPSIIHVYDYDQDFFLSQSMAGKADVCKGCPGRELCLSQGRWVSLHTFSTGQGYRDIPVRVQTMQGL